MKKTPIAFVDDHTLMRTALAAVINGFDNCTVILQADNGRDFIQKLVLDDLPEIVFMDIQMPVMNGYAATQWLQQHHPSVKIIALSMIDTEYAITTMVKNGACAFINKDAEPPEFRKTLDHVHEAGFYFGGEYGALVRKALQHPKYNKPVSVTGFSERELHYLELCCTELGCKEIASALNLSVKQLEYLQDKLCRQLSLENRTQLALFASQNALIGFTPPPANVEMSLLQAVSSIHFHSVNYLFAIATR